MRDMVGRMRTFSSQKRNKSVQLSCCKLAIERVKSCTRLWLIHGHAGSLICTRS